MRQPFGPTDFFALEAGDCLDRLERLLSRPEGVPGDEFVRHVRLLRGAALMAQLQPIALAGAAFEGLARAVRDGRHPWNAATRETALGAVDDFRGLVRRAAGWTGDDDARAGRLTALLAELAGRVPTAPTPGADATAGVRTFVAREGARLAEALEDAAHALVETASPRQLLEGVLARLQPLRGLAGLSELGAVPDLLDGIELVVTDLRTSAPTAEGAALLEAAGRALDDTARGHAAAPSVRIFAASLLAHLGAAADIVPIEALFRDGDPAPYVSLAGGRQPTERSLGAVELVSQGDHLAQVADRLAEARDDAERDLRLAGLFGSLHALQASAAAMPGIAAFARDALRRLGAGEPSRDPSAFVERLRRAAHLLRRAGEAPETVPPSAWDGLLGTPKATTPRVEVAGPVDDEGDVVPIESLLAPEPEPPAVPIETLLADEPVVPIATLAPDEGETARTTFESSVAEYLARVHQESALAHTPVVVPSVVSIDALLYRGPAARGRASELHAEVSRRLRAGDDWTALRPLIEEILDLVPLALDHD
jgi:hypothetical protein